MDFGVPKQLLHTLHFAFIKNSAEDVPLKVQFREEHDKARTLSDKLILLIVEAPLYVATLVIYGLIEVKVLTICNFEHMRLQCMILKLCCTS